MSIWPANKSFTANPPPLYGTPTILTLPCLMMSSPPKCAMLPGPLVPKFKEPGLLRAATNRSFKFLKGEAAGTAKMLGPVAVRETGMKSFSML